jgi:FkbM family methyltransferase
MKISKNGYEFNVHETTNWNFWHKMETGEWEPYTFDIFDEYLTPETTYIDIGAWIGPTVLYASKLSKKCYAYEPDPVACRHLVANINANKITNIVVVGQAIMGHDGMTVLGSDELGNSETRYLHKDNQFSVPCHKLQSVVDRFDIVNPIFIKMDVEGAEEFILKDNEFIEKYKPTLYVSLHPQLFSKEVEALETIRKTGSIYKHKCEFPNSILFTDEEQ